MSWKCVPLPPITVFDCAMPHHCLPSISNGILIFFIFETMLLKREFALFRCNNCWKYSQLGDSQLTFAPEINQETNLILPPLPLFLSAKIKHVFDGKRWIGTCYMWWRVCVEVCSNITTHDLNKSFHLFTANRSANWTRILHALKREIWKHVLYSMRFIYESALQYGWRRSMPFPCLVSLWSDPNQKCQQ